MKEINGTASQTAIHFAELPNRGLTAEGKKMLKARRSKEAKSTAMHSRPSDLCVISANVELTLDRSSITNKLL
jgi:hypothetical protein